MSATQVASPNTPNTPNIDNGLSFEVREIEYDDDSVPTPSERFSSSYNYGTTPGHHEDIGESSPMPEAEPETPIRLNPSMRSNSSALTSPTATAAAAVDDDDAGSSMPSFQCSPAMATADGMYGTHEPEPESAPPAIRTHPNVKRLQFGENPETLATLKFLESQRIDTTALVTQHIMKYGSRARIAVSGDGDVVGFALFDNEIDQEQLRDMATYTHPKEIKQYVESKPFIFLQLLIMDPHFVAVTNTIVGAEWKKELVAQFCDCVTKNGKIGIARTESDNQSEIEFYRECGFFTMHDMGIPSYPSSKGADISVLAYTPLGKEGTAEIFRKFYSMGARF
jgi:hypothetical protein